VSEAESGPEVSKDLIEAVVPHLSPPVKRFAGGTAADSGNGVEISDTMIITIIAAKSSY